MQKSPIALYFRQLGDPQATPLIMLHGLFGSSANWMGIAHRLETDYRIVIPDLRNHGRSAQVDRNGYPDMVADILHLMDQLGLDSAHVVGHSMGGKLAMWLALTNPDRLNKLVVADVAPVQYSHRFERIFSGLEAIDLARLRSRRAADEQLSHFVESRQVRQYLLQSLQKQQDAWEWRLNLPVLRREITALTGFPAVAGRTFPGAALFVYGGNSDYVQATHVPVIRASFPFARLRMLAGLGHWIYAEEPETFSQVVAQFFA